MPRAEGSRPIGAIPFGYRDNHIALLYFYDPFAYFSSSEGCGYFGWLVFLASGGLLISKVAFVIQT